MKQSLNSSKTLLTLFVVGLPVAAGTILLSRSDRVRETTTPSVTTGHAGRPQQSIARLAAKIQPGLDAETVVARVGPPTKRSQAVNSQTWIYMRSDGMLQVLFVEGRVQKIGIHGPLEMRPIEAVA